MSQIIQLDQGLINKIAAGEVVERPLSVVKELVENAIDAGASIITVEILDGGLAKIRVTDNGGGISKNDLELAFLRHATSKIGNLEDLFQVETLGFRGEALSSIAAVSQVEMITKTALSILGTRVEIHGGAIQTCQDIGCANGTTVVVSNLFYNTPARRKFLKKPATEAGYISDCLERLALGNPGLTLRYINNGKIIFQTNGNGELKTVMLNIYGREAATKVVSVNARAGEMSLHGLVGKPEIARGNRQHGSFFINGRYVQSKLLTKAVEAAMSTMLPAGKFPLFALTLSLPFDALDVNVHPTKMDVRFEDEEGVYSFIEGAVHDTLLDFNLIPSVRHKPKDGGSHKGAGSRLPQKPMNAHENVSESGSIFVRLNEFPRKSSDDSAPAQGNIFSNTSEDIGPDAEDAIRKLYMSPTNALSAKEKLASSSTAPQLQSSLNSEIFGTGSKQAAEYRDTSDHNIHHVRAHDAALAIVQNQNEKSNTKQKSDFTQSNALSPQEISASQDETKHSIFTNYKIHSLLFSTYWIVTQGESMYMIDQHAAHERIKYENMLKKLQQEKVPSQQLLFPQPVHLTNHEKVVLLDNMQLFQNFGFGISQDDDNNFAITAVPALINGPLNASFFSDILDKINDVGFSKKSPYDYKLELIAQAACKAAVKGGDILQEQEAHALITQLLELDNPFTCPHGRPTIIEITRAELERRFKRS